MEEQKRLRLSRRGYRAHLATLTTSLSELTERCQGQPLEEDDVIALTSLLEQFTRKKEILHALDEKLTLLTEEKDLEAEILESEELQNSISRQITRVKRMLDAPRTPQPSHSTSTTSSLLSPPERRVDDPEEPQPRGAAAQENVIRLPRLNMPTFSGDPLSWEPFWDSFDAAVHSSPSLSAVQKLTYLRSQLHGSAAKVISGLTLTSSSYDHSIALLKDRFGQPHKLIHAHMQALLELPSPTDTLIGLETFYDAVEGHIRSLSSLGKPVTSYGDMLVTVILNKLPDKTRKNIIREHGSDEWTLEVLQTAIKQELHILQLEIQANSQPQTQLHATALLHIGSTKSTNRPHQPEQRKQQPCVFCKGPHSPVECNVITDKEQRLQLVKSQRLCFNCLGRHKASQCTSRHRCRKCQRKHHTSICPTPEGNDSENKQLPGNTPTTSSTTGPRAPPPPTQNTVPTSTSLHLATVTPSTSVLHLTGTNVCLLKTAIGNISANGHCAEANILFDEGSQRSFLAKGLADSLNLHPHTTETVALSTFGSQGTRTMKVDVTTIHLVTPSEQRIPLSVLIVPTIAAPLQRINTTNLTELPHLSGIQLALPITTGDHSDITLLIGADHYWDVVEDHIIRGNGPTAMQSKLGYLLSGPMVTPMVKNDTAISILHVATQQTPESAVEKFWTIEAMGISQQDENTNRAFLEQYISTSIQRGPSGSYIARFPWKKEHPPLPSNYVTCVRRVRALARKLAATPDLLDKYNEILTDQEQRGFIEKVRHPSKPQDCHYIPHHAIRKESPTTPLRIVYDCSCHQSKELPSLNDCLMSGDLRLNDLCSIILRFRLHKYGMCTDIEKAFLHVHLNEEDRDFTRFLWLRNPSDPESELITFRFRVVLFGAVCSPFMLNATLLYHISQYTSATSKDMLENLYVDNIITGCESEETAITYYQTARAIMKDANFNLRSWASNSHRLVEQMHNDKTAAEPGPINVLGLQWDTTNDTMSLTLKIPIPTRHTLVTKREVLRESSKVFDPIGILSPVTVRAKILIQKLWQQDIDWDEPLNKAAEEEWLSIAADIQDAINLLSITRRYFHALNLSGQTVKLHVFADASPRAYGAVAFICGDDQVSFVMAKSRVAPLKQLSLPRLELMAALTAARLSKFIRDALHSLNIITHLWADSQIVLHWLQSNKNLNSFVHHRVSEIHQLTNDATWNFCLTSDNPADLLTRGITSSQLKSSTLWNHGPEWLTSTSNWPTWQATPALRLQALAITSAVFIPNEKQNSTHGLHTIIDVTDYSTFYKLIAVTAYVMRFIHFSRGNRDTGPLTTAELQQAKHMWIKDCQRQVFSKEGTNLQSNPPAAKRLPLVRQLRLFLDKNNYLRCGGRIHNAPLSQLSKFPYLLPPHHPLTNLIIRSTHLRLLHAGTNSTLTALRQEFWVPTARQRVKSIIRKCTTCKKYSGKFYPNPDPAPLPEIRVRDAPPFTVTGVDFTGALYVQEHNQESKVYICLYTCANTRAIHLEVVTDLSVDMFLLSFRRFASRRSLPSIMVSDNASTYQSAAEELQQLFRSKELTHHLSKQGVQWRFIPKRAPWYGGWWEQLIGLTKSTLKKVLGRACISLTTLQTLVAEVEAVLNDRPLTYVSSDITDLEPLTPSHLLYGRRISSLPYVAVDKEEIDDPTYGSAEDVDRRAKRQALTLQHFRRRWRDEYLTSLREFHQGTGKNKQTIKVGDVVLVHNDTPRTMWKLAVIESLIRGNDGLVRAANIRTATGKTNRPIARLVPLEVSSSIDDPIQHTSQTTNAATTTPGIGPSTEVTNQGGRPRREAAQRGMERVANWIQQMRAPREDVMN